MKNMLPNLQMLRFLAAAMVLISHLQHEAAKMSFGGTPYAPWNGIFWAGGVDIFFIISGFIMYSISSQDFGREGAPRNFFLRRLVRIVPPYWIFTLGMIAAAFLFASHISHPNLDWGNVISSFFFFPHDNAYGKPYPVLMLGWTLNYEFFFYVIFGLALFFNRTCGLLFIFGVIGVLALCGALQLFEHGALGFWTNTITIEFLLGILLAIARERGLRVSMPVGLLCIVIGFIGMYMTMQMGIVGTKWVIRFLWMGLPALFICAGAVLLEQKSEVSGPSRWLVFLGDTSYALYLSHPFSLNLVALLWKRFGLGMPYLYLAISAVVSLGCGTLVHLWIEKPLTRALNERVRHGGRTRPLAPEQT